MKVKKDNAKEIKSKKGDKQKNKLIGVAKNEVGNDGGTSKISKKKNSKAMLNGGGALQSPEQKKPKNKAKAKEIVEETKVVTDLKKSKKNKKAVESDLVKPLVEVKQTKKNKSAQKSNNDLKSKSTSEILLSLNSTKPTKKPASKPTEVVKEDKPDKENKTKAAKKNKNKESEVPMLVPLVAEKPSKKQASKPSAVVKQTKEEKPEKQNKVKPTKKNKEKESEAPLLVPITPEQPAKKSKKSKNVEEKETPKAFALLNGDKKNKKDKPEVTKKDVKAEGVKKADKKGKKEGKKENIESPVAKKKFGKADKVKKVGMKKKKSSKKPVPSLTEAPVFNEENFNSILTKENIKKTVTALNKVVKKETDNMKNMMFTDFRYVLDVGLFVIPSAPKRSVKLRVKHSIVGEDDEVLFIVRDLKRGGKVEYEPTIHFYQDLLREKGITAIKAIMPFNQLKKEYSSYEMKRKLSNLYDYFICDGSIVGHVFALLGRNFSNKQRCTMYSVRTANTHNLEKEINTALHKTSFKQGNKGDTVSLIVGNHNHSPAQVAENILEIAEQFKAHLPGGQPNIRNMIVKVNLKGTSSLPIYVSMGKPPKETPYLIGMKEMKLNKLKEQAEEILDKFTFTNEAGIAARTPEEIESRKRKNADQTTPEVAETKKSKKEKKKLAEAAKVQEETKPKEVVGNKKNKVEVEAKDESEDDSDFDPEETNDNDDVSSDAEEEDDEEGDDDDEEEDDEDEDSD